MAPSPIRVGGIHHGIGITMDGDGMTRGFPTCICHTDIGATGDIPTTMVTDTGIMVEEVT